MTLLLIDSASLWYRAYYGMPDSLTGANGQPVNAIRGFIDMTARLINTYQPDRFALCLDGDWRPSWRVELFPEYKSNRVDESGEGEEEPDLLTPQIPIILDFFEAMGFSILGADDYEADDVIATLAKREPGPIRVATGDRDLFQIVGNGEDTKIIYLAKGISAHDLVDSNWISQKYGIPEGRYGLFAMIRGDASDGLPGIKGIGEKGAAEIVQHFEDMPQLLAAVETEDNRIRDLHRRRIRNDLEYAKIAPKLVTCATDVPLPQIDLRIPKAILDSKRLEALKSDFGLQTSFERLRAALQW